MGYSLPPTHLLEGFTDNVVGVFLLQGQGRVFLTLQDELKSEGLSAATSLFANILCREIVVKELLSRGGGDMRVCSTFKVVYCSVEPCASLLTWCITCTSPEADQRTVERDAQVLIDQSNYCCCIGSIFFLLPS